MGLLSRLHEQGLTVALAGGRLQVEPRSALTEALRATIRINKGTLIREVEDALAGQFDLTDQFSAALRLGALQVCEPCIHFRPRPGREPDGWCGKFADATWARVPFQCTGYETQGEQG